MLKVENFRVGLINTNCYIVTDVASGVVAVVDPGEISEDLILAIEKIPKGNVKYVLITHGHFDHIGGVNTVVEKTGARVVIGNGEERLLSDVTLNLSEKMNIVISDVRADILVNDGDSLNLGETEIKVLSLPGHTAAGVGYFAGGKLFCGDTLFKGSMGRSDLKGGNEEQLFRSLKKLSKLPDKTIVYSGHGERSTIEDEKSGNVFMRFAMTHF